MNYSALQLEFSCFPNTSLTIEMQVAGVCETLTCEGKKKNEKNSIGSTKSSCFNKFESW